MKAAIWGCRGTVPAPGPGTVRYGGNTTCVGVETTEGRPIVLDCGSGMRLLGESLLPDPPAEIDVLLTHMHLDHVMGLGFFGPLFMNKTLRIWGPRLGDVPLADRLATYLGPPLFPMPFADIPVTLEVTEVERDTWQIGGADRDVRTGPASRRRARLPARGGWQQPRVHPRQRARP